MLRHLPVLSVVCLLLAAYFVPLIKPRLRLFSRAATLSILVFATAISVYFVSVTMDGSVIRYSVGGWQAPYGIELAVTLLTAIVMLVVSFVTLLVFVYRLVDPSAPQDQAPTWYDAVIVLLVAGIFGITQANDLFNLYVFVEISSLAACALVAAGKGGKPSAAAFKYLMLATVGSGFVVFAIGLLYIITGYLGFSQVHETLQLVWQAYPHVVYLSVCFFIVGFGIKSALFPLHVWLPDAHSSAPTTSSALLSGVVVKAYLVALLKLFYMVYGQDLLHFLGVPRIILFLGMAGVIGGSLFAMVQTEVKRMLAYSTVAQLGYIFVGLGLNNELGLTAAIFQIVSHACMKSALFVIAGHFVQNGKKMVQDYVGIGKQQPILFAAFTVCALSMIGIPLFSGFITKWALFNAALAVNQFAVILAVVVSGLLNAAYFLPILWAGWFRGESKYARPRLQVNLALPVVMAMMVLWLGMAPDSFMQAFSTAANLMLRW
jgi:multicomponent Na+:H+ antiporter subunit D